MSTDTETDRQMPCGHCPAGTYALEAVMGGIELFANCQTRRDALRAAPRCKFDGRKICMGSRDFIVASRFPLDVPAIMAMAE